MTIATRVHTADEAAVILRCTSSWLKEQARRRKIPFTMIGGSYRWTDAHLDEIIALGEHGPIPERPPPVPSRRPPVEQEAPVLLAGTPRGPRKPRTELG